MSKFKILGLANIADISAFDEPVIGAYGRMAETSTGKDTTSGHWEMMGHHNGAISDIL